MANINAANRKSTQTKATSPNTTPTEAPRVQILKKATCPLIAPSSKGQLTYNVGHREDDKSIHLRVAANSGGGYFSHEWIPLDAIAACIAAQPAGQPFKSLVLKRVYKSTGANNHGFLAAVLRAEGFLKPVAKAPFSHFHGDGTAFTAAVQKALKDKVDLVDEVAIREAEKDKIRRQRAAAMQTASKQKAKATPTASEVSAPTLDVPIQSASDDTAAAVPTVETVKPPRKSGAKAAH